MRAGPWMALDAERFERWQPNLLALLNEPKLARFARGRMGLGAHVERGEEILSISPHQITMPVRSGLRAVFMPQPAMQRSLYRAWRPIFWGMHAYDWMLPDRVSQRWVQSLIRPLRPAFEGFGLATLTAYSQAGYGGSNVTCDGYTYWSGGNVSFSTLVSNAGTTSYPGVATLDVWLACGSTTNNFIRLDRAFASFDTSSLGSTAIISDGTVSLYSANAATVNLGAMSLTAVGSTQANANTCVAADHSQVGSTSFGSISSGLWGSSGYQSIAFNAQGIAAISKTGLTKLAFRIEWDRSGSFGGTWFNSQSNVFFFYGADQGSGYAPRLAVTYTLPTVAMRRELSALGTRMGSRQVQG